MKALLYKELKLAMHPAAVIFLSMAVMLLIPNYPYQVAFFYTGLGVFFICLNGRENKDIPFTLLMPTAKKNAVKARFDVVMGMQLLTLLLAVPFAALRQKILPEGNMAGMDANIALFGCVFVLYGGFNFIFFTKYYGNTDKVGVPFLLSSVWVFLWMAATETCVFVVPFVRDKLDTADPQFLTEKLIVLLAGMLIYAVVTWAAYRISAEKFDKLDI